MRYGNVLGSRGSVLPLFLKQRETGVVTVTDPRMTRFWITLEQASRFVLRALDTMIGGELYVPKIPSMTMQEMARALAPGLPSGSGRNSSRRKTARGDDSRRRGASRSRLPGLLCVAALLRLGGRGAAAHHNGHPVPHDFRYASDTNPYWLSGEDLLHIARAQFPEHFHRLLLTPHVTFRVGARSKAA